MKKVLFFLSFLMVINFANAQSYTYDSIANLDFGWYLINVKNLAELHDGNIVSNFSLTELDDQGQLLDDYGECFHCGQLCKPLLNWQESTRRR